MEEKCCGGQAQKSAQERAVERGREIVESGVEKSLYAMRGDAGSVVQRFSCADLPAIAEWAAREMQQAKRTSTAQAWAGLHMAARQVLDRDRADLLASSLGYASSPGIAR